MEKLVQESLAILALLAAVTIVIRRLPKVDLGHVAGFTRRRAMNWLPLGLTYAFLYMGRYNINVAKVNGVMTKEELGIVTFCGTLTYALAFLVNGPLTDRIGGRKTILMAAIGSSVANLAMGAFLVLGLGIEADGSVDKTGVILFSAAYIVNMYFQAFGAVSIVKVNAQWFHVLERGVLGGVFGILISLGIYFAYDWGRLIGEAVPAQWVFFIPTLILLGFAVLDYFLVFDKPSDAGFPDIDVADASSDDDGKPITVWQLALRMARNPIILTIAFIELFSGFVRNGIMSWTFIFFPETGQADSFAFKHWGMILCIAGILGGVFAGTVSDKVFQSRRGPSAVILYSMLIVAVGLGAIFIASPVLAVLLGFACLCIIGVHGMLSGTASMDFGGKKNAGMATGLIDGMVYLGTAAQSLTFGFLLPTGDDAKDPGNWRIWLLIILPVAIVGFLLSLRIWNARPKAATAAAAKLAAASAGPPPARVESE